ncbi:MAG: type II 3-dehydroquinate dehydratase [Chloroflexi bacterium]|nr:type II 3-dehydroquinate dehydratase [Chloroflexota bacterium]
MKLLLLNGPNLNRLGQRDPAQYGRQTLAEIVSLVERRARELGVEIVAAQANGEGQLVDLVQKHASDVQGIIVNPGALTHYGYSLRDALADTGLPVVEVHLSNVYAREEWRQRSVIAPIARGKISGLGWRGYLFALEYLVNDLHPVEGNRP